MLISPLPHPLSQAWPRHPQCHPGAPGPVSPPCPWAPGGHWCSPSAGVYYKAKHPLLVHPPFAVSSQLGHVFPEFLGLNLILEAINFNRAADCSRTGIRSSVNKITFLHLPSSSSLWPLLGEKNHNKIGKKIHFREHLNEQAFLRVFSPQTLNLFS